MLPNLKLNLSFLTKLSKIYIVFVDENLNDKKYIMLNKTNAMEICLGVWPLQSRLSLLVVISLDTLSTSLQSGGSWACCSTAARPPACSSRFVEWTH